jgi:branched-chain amino acid transport system permease protein
VGVLFSSWLSAYTQAWQFYLGAFFILIVMTTPGGLASLIDRAWHLRYGDIDAAWRCAWAVAGWGTGALAGLILATEMAYQASLGSLAETGAGAAPLLLWGWRIDVHAPFPWVIAVLCMAAEQRCHGLASPREAAMTAPAPLILQGVTRPSIAARSCAASTCNCSPASAVR